ncbi:MAG: CHAP domain-containing protein, partial [Suipraeoptans sp.]
MRINNKESDMKIKNTGSSIKKITSELKVNRISVSELQTDISDTKSDPSQFMSKRQKKRWKKLSPNQKEKYLAKAEKKIAKKKHQQTRYNKKTYVDRTKKRQDLAKASVKSNGKALVGASTTTVIKTAKVGKETSSKVVDGIATGNVVLDVGKKVAKEGANQFGRMANIKDNQKEQEKQSAKNEFINNNDIAQTEEPNKIVAFFSAISTMVVGAVMPVFSGIVAVVSSVLVVILIITTIISALLGIAEDEDNKISGGTSIVAVALAEVGQTGDKFWQYTMGSTYVNGTQTPWCASFVSWCANECGYIDSGLFPKSGAVSTYKSFFESKGQFQSKENYVPKTGDLLIMKSDGASHIGIVQYVEGDRVVTVEGNYGVTVTTVSRLLTNSQITGYATPDYPDVDVIEIPEPYGTVYTYMGWQMITSPSSAQYKLRQEAGMNFDEKGFGKIGNRYVIACTTTFGAVGDYVDWYLDNGEVIHAIIGDIKSQNYA